MKHLLSLLLLFPLFAQGQKALKRPLTFVPAQNVLLIDPTNANVVQRAMQVSPYLSPQTPQLAADSLKFYRRQLRQAFSQHHESAISTDAHTLQQLFLLSGEARFARGLDSLRLVYDTAQRNDSTSTAAAQQLLNTLGWIAATEGRNLYINLRANCLITVRTPELSLNIDQIEQNASVKFRITGLPAAQSGTGRTRFALHLLLPEDIAPRHIFLNGHRLLDPQWQRGYLVLDREWRNMDEVFYEL